MKTKEQFIKDAIKKFGNKYDYSLVKYYRMDKKVKIICPVHGIFEKTPSGFLNSKGCPKCSTGQKTTEQFIEEAKKVHGDKYDYSLTEYINNRTKVKIICSVHGIFEKSPNEHLSGKAGCPECSNQELTITKHELFKKDKKQFIEEAKRIHGDKYDYSLVEYYNTHTKVKIICSEHGMFEQTPHHHLLGNGCPECGKITRANSRLNDWEDVLRRIKETHGDKYDYSKSEYLGINTNIEIICPIHGSFWMSPSNHMAGQDCPKCMLGQNCSKQEKELGKYLTSLDLKWEKTRDILNGKELDFYIKDKNIAIEYDGVYWHSDKNNYYKYEECKNKGIRLIQINEWEWINNNKKIKEYLKDTLTENNTIRIFARKCCIKEIDNDTYKKFCEENHLQGYGIASIRIGLFYNNELIQIMSFSKSRFSKEYEYEMIRECSKLGYTIIGGKSKLLNFFEKNYNPKSLISYCEKNKFSGNSYLKLGFKLLKESNPSYEYFKGNNKYSRIQFQKHKLKDKLDFFDENLTEWENMKNNKYLRIFDYGNFVFVKEYK